MQIKYWNNFKKRINSTKRPTGGTTLNVELKDDCSVENPIFILHGIFSDISYVQAFGKYYFIDEIVILTGNRTMVKCSVDLLATYKSEINSTEAFVMRSSTEYNKYIRDDVVSITNESVTNEVFSSQSSEMPFDEDGCFIVSVVNDVSSETAYVCNYILYPGLMSSLAFWLSGQGDYTDAGAAWNTIEGFLIMQFGDVFDCVRSCKWIPVDYDVAKLKGSLDTIHIGKYDTGVPGYRVTSNALVEDELSEIDLTNKIYDDFRAAAPFTSVDVFIPFYGLVSVNPSMVYFSKIKIFWYIDLTTGDCYVRGKNYYDKLLFSINYDIGVDTPIAQVGRTGVAVAQAAFSTVGALATANPLALANSGVGLITAIASNGVTQKGSLSGRAMYSNNKIAAYVTMMVTTPIDSHNSIYGRPLMGTRQLSSLSGFCQCNNASVSCDCTQPELAKLNGMLNEGIYLE